MSWNRGDGTCNGAASDAAAAARRGAPSADGTVDAEEEGDYGASNTRRMASHGSSRGGDRQAHSVAPSSADLSYLDDYGDDSNENTGSESERGVVDLSRSPGSRSPPPGLGPSAPM